MIVVAGFNTAVDKYAEAEALRLHAVNRLTNVSAYPGGKGVHVAQTCALLGEPVRLVGIIDDLHAPLFERTLEQRAVGWRGVRIDQPIRSCHAIRDRSGGITEILEPGPHLSQADVAQLEEAFIEACRGAQFAVLCGSLPGGCPVDLYARMVSRIAALGCRCLVDTSGAALASAILARPAVLKPNAEEAGQLVQQQIVDIPSAANSGAALAARGIARVVISMGADGAVAAWDGHLAKIAAPRQAGPGGVGSGDCFAGALAVGIVRGGTADDTLRMAAACGAANVLLPEPGFFRVADAQRLASQVTIDWF